MRMIMINFLLSLLPVSLGIWCVHILFQEGQLFGTKGRLFGDLGAKIKGPKSKPGEPPTKREFYSKPLFDCPVCMSSLWGLIGFFAIRYFFNVDLPWRQLLPFIFCLCGLNTLLSKLTTKERIIVDE